MGQLEDGIAAAKAGDLQLARSLLTDVVTEDESNERAWLWLSGVVDTLEERQTCLENVLELNPDNQLARRGLARLERERSLANLSEPEPAASVAPAAVASVEDHPVAVDEQIAAAEPVTQPLVKAQFEDVWSTDADLCAYCATPVDEDDKRCGRCRRPLEVKEFRYPATASLHLFWLVLVALSILLLFQAIYKWRIEENDLMAILHIVPSGLFLLLSVGIYFRLFAAHVISVFLLVLVIVLSVANLLTPFEAVPLDAASGDVAVFGVNLAIMERMGLFLKITQGAIAAIALFYALFRVAPEFDRVSKRVVARVARGVNTAADHHVVARRLVQDGMWASAVLHWQRAAAIEPSSIIFQRSLAKSYIKLGHYERAKDVLEAAQDLTMLPKTRADMEQLLAWVTEKIQAPTPATANQRDGQ